MDSSNFYHQLKVRTALPPGRLNFARRAERLVSGREWLETRLYVGEVDPSAGKLHEDQRRFLETFRKYPKHQVILGRIQSFYEENPLAMELLRYLATLPTRIDRDVYKTLVEMAKRSRKVRSYKEKGVDVALACDMVRFAQENRYDLGYLISNDGDLAPAVEIVRTYGKRVFAAGCVAGPRLNGVCDRAIVLKQDFLRDCQY